jgi:Flp pilus assembly protein TadD
MEPGAPRCPQVRRLRRLTQRSPQVSIIALALALAGCAGAQQESLSRQPSLRVADAALAAGAPEVAVRVADLTLERDPHNAPALVAKGDGLYAMGQRGEARAAYRQAVAADPKLASAQLGLGRTLVQSDPAAAEAAFLAAIAEQPDNGAALNNLGIARDLLGRHAEAQDAYRQALAIAPGAADVKVNLGLSLALTGDKGAAVEVLREAAAVPAAVQERGKELAAALALAGDETDAHQVLSASPAQQPAPGNMASADMPPPPVVASREAPVAVKPKQDRLTKDLAIAARPEPPSQPDEPSPLPVLTAPVAAVAHANLSPLPHAAPEALVDTAALSAPAPAVQPAASDASPAMQAPAEPTPEAGAFVQLASVHSLDAAWYEWKRLSRRLPELLGGHTPVIVHADALGQSYWCLRTFGFTDLAGATAMCSEAHGSSGLRCWARVAS